MNNYKSIYKDKLVYIYTERERERENEMCGITGNCGVKKLKGVLFDQMTPWILKSVTREQGGEQDNRGPYLWISILSPLLHVWNLSVFIQTVSISVCAGSNDAAGGINSCDTNMLEDNSRYYAGN